MDMTETIAPNSSQINADDLLAGPVTVTVTDVRRVDSDQPVEIVTAEYGTGRVFRPAKTVRRILVAAWGPDASLYPGRRITLYCDPTVKWGGQEVGGIRISHLSHIGKPLKLAVTATRGKKVAVVVQPLPDEAPTVGVKMAHPNAGLLREIGEAADAAGVDRKNVAATWAESHGGEAIAQATDTAALEALRNELHHRASQHGPVDVEDPPDPPAEPLWPATAVPGGSA